jgi:hypothetical protein
MVAILALAVAGLSLAIVGAHTDNNMFVALFVASCLEGAAAGGFSLFARAIKAQSALSSPKLVWSVGTPPLVVITGLVIVGIASIRASAGSSLWAALIVVLMNEVALVGLLILVARRRHVAPSGEG